MNLKSALIGSAAAGALCLAAPAHANDFYVSVFGGFNSLDGDDISFGPFSYSTLASYTVFTGGYGFGALSRVSGNTTWIFPGSGSVVFKTISTIYARTYASGFRESEFDEGFVFGFAGGLSFGEGWRGELELAWRKNDMGDNNPISVSQRLDTYRFIPQYVYGFGLVYTGGTLLYSTTFTTGNPLTWTNTNPTYTQRSVSATATGSGEVSSFAIMANIWKDFELGGDSPVIPFVGFGVGMVNLDVDYSGRAVLPTNTLNSISSVTTIQNTAVFGTQADGWTWGAQAAVGLAYDFGGMTLSAQYRYFTTGDIDLAGQDFGVSSHEGLIALIFPLGN